jgi:hypothetical protein
MAGLVPAAGWDRRGGTAVQDRSSGVARGQRSPGWPLDLARTFVRVGMSGLGAGAVLGGAYAAGWLCVAALVSDGWGDGAGEGLLAFAFWLVLAVLWGAVLGGLTGAAAGTVTGVAVGAVACAPHAWSGAESRRRAVVWTTVAGFALATAVIAPIGLGQPVGAVGGWLVDDPATAVFAAIVPAAIAGGAGWRIGRGVAAGLDRGG